MAASEEGRRPVLQSVAERLLDQTRVRRATVEEVEIGERLLCSLSQGCDAPVVDSPVSQSSVATVSVGPSSTGSVLCLQCQNPMTFDQWSAGATCGWAGCLCRFCSGPCRDKHRERCPWRTGARAEKQQQQQPVVGTCSDELVGDLDWYARYCTAVHVGGGALSVLDGLDAAVECLAKADVSRRGLYSLVA